jgi:hypothetical protein
VAHLSDIWLDTAQHVVCPVDVKFTWPFRVPVLAGVGTRPTWIQRIRDGAFLQLRRDIGSLGQRFNKGLDSKARGAYNVLEGVHSPAASMVRQDSHQRGELKYLLCGTANSYLITPQQGSKYTHGQTRTRPGSRSPLRNAMDAPPNFDRMMTGARGQANAPGTDAPIADKCVFLSLDVSLTHARFVMQWRGHTYIVSRVAKSGSYFRMHRAVLMFKL